MQKNLKSLFLLSYKQILELSKSSLWRSWIESRLAEADNMVYTVISVKRKYNLNYT